MVPVVMFVDAIDYHEYIFSDFRNIDNAVLVRAYPFRIGGVAYRTWNAVRSLTERKENFPRFWLRRLLLNNGISQESDVAFCFANSTLTYYNDQFIDWLRETYPKARIYLLCLDSIAFDYGEKVLRRAQSYDAVFSFLKSDCEKYGWRHFWGLMPTKDKKWFERQSSENPKNRYDICFIGSDRGRYPELKKLYIRLTSEGLKCLFLVKTDREAFDDVDRVLIIRENIPFRQMLRMEGTAEILLDYGFIPTGDVGFTLRVMDAVGFNCGIITNNCHMINCPLSSSKKVGIVDNLDDITPEMIYAIESKREVSYTNPEIFSADRIVESISRDFII